MRSYTCHLFKGFLPASREARIDEILEPFGAQVMTINDPAGGPRGWIESPSMGAPFDGERAREMRAALEGAGLWPIEKLVLSDLTDLEDAELVAAWRRGNDAGEGFPAGNDCDEIDELDEDWSFLRFVEDLAAWVDSAGDLVLVADGNGPWGVVIEPEPQHAAIVCKTTATHYTIRYEDRWEDGGGGYWEQTHLTDLTDEEAIAALRCGDIAPGDVDILDPQYYDLPCEKRGICREKTYLYRSDHTLLEAK